MVRKITVSYEGETGLVERRIREAIVNELQKSGIHKFKMYIRSVREEGGEDGEE